MLSLSKIHSFHSEFFVPTQENVSEAELEKGGRGPGRPFLGGSHMCDGM